MWSRGRVSFPDLSADTRPAPGSPRASSSPALTPPWEHQVLSPPHPPRPQPHTTPGPHRAMTRRAQQLQEMWSSSSFVLEAAGACPRPPCGDRDCDGDSAFGNSQDTSQDTCVTQSDGQTGLRGSTSDQQNLQDKGQPASRNLVRTVAAVSGPLQQRTMGGAAQSNRDLLSPSLEAGVRNPGVARKYSHPARTSECDLYLERRTLQM